MGYRDQLALSIMANQINDYGQYFKKISLRNAYDVLLFSQKTDAVKALEATPVCDFIPTPTIETLQTFSL